MKTNQGLNFNQMSGVSQQNKNGIQSQQINLNNFGQYNQMGFNSNNNQLNLQKQDSMENKKDQFPYILNQNMEQNNMNFMNNQNMMNSNMINPNNMNNQNMLNTNMINPNNMNNQNMMNSNMMNPNNINNMNTNMMNQNNMTNMNPNMMNFNNMNSNMMNPNNLNQNNMPNMINMIQNQMNASGLMNNNMNPNNINNNINIAKNSMKGNNMNSLQNMNISTGNVSNMPKQSQYQNNPFSYPTPFGENTGTKQDNPKGSKVTNTPFGQDTMNNPKGSKITNKPFGKDDISDPKGTNISNTPFGQNTGMNPSNMNNFNNNNQNNNPNFAINNPGFNNDNNNNDDNQLLNQISNTHTFKLSKYYDYKPSEATSHLNNLLKDMDSFGDIIKNNIEREKISNPNKFISVDEALSYNDQNNFNSNSNNFGMGNMMYVNKFTNDPKNDFYVLAVLKTALECEGCTCEIERDLPQMNEEKEAYTAVQFIVNGMYKFKKYKFIFDFGEEKNNILLSNQMEQNKFNITLAYKLKSLLNVDIKDIVMTNPRKGSYKITAVIKKSNFNELMDNQLLNQLNQKQEYNNHLINVEKSILLNGCKLNRAMLDKRGDRNSGWGINELRGGKPYNPPLGWTGFGLRVLDRYDGGDNTWIDFKNNPGEWSVAYHGIGASLSGQVNLNNLGNPSFNNMMLNTVFRQQFKDEGDRYHPNQKVGEGVYMTPYPNIMEQYCNTYNIQGKKYKIGLMCRVMPDKIRCPTSTEDYWVINGTDNEVRPYRILIKEVM